MYFRETFSVLDVSCMAIENKERLLCIPSGCCVRAQTTAYPNVCDGAFLLGVCQKEEKVNAFLSAFK